MSYRELLAPAIEAAKGHPLDFWAAAQHARNVGKISAYPSSVEILMKNGHPIAAGELFVQTDLARTLTTIARDGADVFYRGALARKSADFYVEQGGLLSKDDLAKYVAEQAEPIHTAYAGLDVYQSAPNSQGIVMLIAINILEGYDLEALGHNSVEYLHEYFLNNRTPYFSLEEDDVNVLVPGKRTRHTVNPALALKDGKPYLAWNTPGGDNQPQAMLQAFLAIVHFRECPASRGSGHGDVECFSRLDVSGKDSRHAHDAGRARGARGQRPRRQGPSRRSARSAAALHASSLGRRRGEDADDRPENRHLLRRGEPGEKRLRSRLVSVMATETFRFPFAFH